MKRRIFTGLIAAMTLFGTAITASENDGVNFSNEDNSTEEKIIVEVAERLEGLTDDQVYESQNRVINSIKSNVTKDFELLDRYHVLNNAFVIRANSNVVAQIKKLDGVASATIDKMHYKKSTDENVTLSTIGVNATGTQEIIAKDQQDLGAEEENISATTMKKPSGTNEGEGTVIAVLDNEFYIKGKTDDEPGFAHVAYKPLPEGTIQRITYDSMKEMVKRTHAARNFNPKKQPGEEGSLYYNSKVPFYYDYGGNVTSYGADGKPDCDVISAIDYHGSHVSSIIGANANEYKGIAPKCQLVCMKVFTEYKADETGKQLGLNSYSGGTETAILSALEDAITLGCDGINMSLGSDLDDFDGDSIYLKTLGRLATASGLMTAIAAGNSGKGAYSFTGGYGNWTTDTVETGILGSYANSGEATIVASAQPEQIYFENAISCVDAQGNITNISYQDQIVNREGYDDDYPENLQMYLKDTVDNEGNVGWVYIPNFGTSADFKNKDVKDKIAVMNRGSTSFIDKYNLAKQNGAKGVIIINNDPTSNEFNFRCSFGDGFTPSMPCALVLYKDKPYFQDNVEGTFSFIEKQASVNNNAKTVSTFTNDGAKFNYDLKPDIASPGDSIRGAVPPHKTEEKENTSISTYEYLSGTSMATPNFAGAQALLLGQKAKDVFAGGTTLTEEQNKAYVDYRKTIDMRIMSTADKMSDAKENPETNKISPTSPRIQGAGMIDLDGALKTKVYLNGLDLDGKEINKSKIVLKNSSDIAKGNLNMSFNAYNEDTTAKSYKVKLTVMRPALEENNKVIQDKYNYTGEIDDISRMAGYVYYKKTYNTDTLQDAPKRFESDATAAQYDVVKLTKQIEYFSTYEDCENNTNAKIIEPGYYYNAAATGYDWQPLPNFTYQSIKDVVLYEGETGQTVTINPGKNNVKIDNWSIPQAEKDKIAKAYPYGCAIEGYVELISVNEEPDLSIPFLGFYSLSDVDESKSLRDAPVVEPFEFNKTEGVSYPSDLVNDITVSLLGKNKADMGSMWVAGYAESTNDIDTSKVLTNETSFNNLNGFHSVGKDPKTGAYYDNASDCIYVGSPKATNTMIIQQFVMRSVNDNYFTIKNSKGEVIYKSVLEDILFHSQQGRYPLYKSHVDSNYLGAGYVAHRAFAIIPLYDVMTNEAFEDGAYTIEFNYQLAYDKSWVSSSYKFVVDSTVPTVSNIETYNKDGEERVRINVADYKLSSAVVGYANAEVNYDSVKNQYYLDMSKEDIINSMDNLGNTFMGDYRPRLYIELKDAAYGTNKLIVHFADEALTQYEIAEGDLKVSYDYKYVDGKLSWVDIDLDGIETEIDNLDGVSFRDNYRKTDTVIKDNGCGGSIAASSSLIMITMAIGLALMFYKKRKLIGGQK